MVRQEQVRSLAMRILNGMDAFQPAEGLNAIGVYDAGGDTVPLAITTAGISRGGEVEALKFVSMVRVFGPTSKSPGEVGTTTITVEMDDGSLERITVAGRNGRFYDSFEFSRFLSRAVRLVRV